MKRQAWHDLRLRFVISHSLVAGQLYSMLPSLVEKIQNKSDFTTLQTTAHINYVG